MLFDFLNSVESMQQSISSKEATHRDFSAKKCRFRSTVERREDFVLRRKHDATLDDDFRFHLSVSEEIVRLADRVSRDESISAWAICDFPTEIDD